MPSTLVNKLLIWLARTLEISPGLAHILLLSLMTTAYGLFEYKPFSSFNQTSFLVIWFGFCTAVLLMTWLAKGEFRKIWR